MSISLNPGIIESDIMRHASSFLQLVGRLIRYPVSYGAITSLYAGTAPAAGELNGKVSIPVSGIAHDAPLYMNWFNSISPTGQGSRFPVIRHWILTCRRSCGSGVKSRSKTFSPVSGYSDLRLLFCAAIHVCLVLIY